MDFIIMVKGTANMFICGPEVIQAVTGQKCTMDEIGSADDQRQRQRQRSFHRRQRRPRDPDRPQPPLLSPVQQPAGPAAPSRPAD